MVISGMRKVGYTALEAVGVVDAPSLQAFKARLDQALSNLSLVGGIPARGKGLALDDL